jgi:type VI secretion system secreted protein Hcp
MSASDIHLKLNGIKGESTSVQHNDEIDVESWAWSVTGGSAAPGGGGGGAGRATFADLSFAHRVDRASPELWKACATGRRIRDAVLSVARAGAGTQDYLIVKLRDVSVTSVALSDAASDALVPLEFVSLAFAKVEYSYKPQNANGSLGAAVEFKFDLVRNKV